MGWLLQSTPNGQITWHNGGTTCYGAFVGTLLDRDVGIVVLTNLTNVGFPDAVGEWALGRLLGNPEIDYAAKALEQAKARTADDAATFTSPASPMPAPPLGGLAGSFGEPNFGTVTVTAAGEGLVAKIAATGAKLQLDPWNGDLRGEPRSRGTVRPDRGRISARSRPASPPSRSDRTARSPASTWSFGSCPTRPTPSGRPRRRDEGDRPAHCAQHGQQVEINEHILPR